MAPKEAVENIKHLLISTSENGVQDHKTLLAAYKKFDSYLTEWNVERPVVILSDGHSSRFDLDVLTFLRSKQMRLYITWPDTTSVLQLLDQVNQSLHSEFRKAKNKLFTSVMTINREGFMLILAEAWQTWTSRESLVNAAKRVGVTPMGLDISLMQQEKFIQAEACIEGPIDESSQQDQRLATTPVIESPKVVRHDSKEYWKAKFDSMSKKYGEVVEAYNEKKSINIAEVPGLLKVTKVKPKITNKAVRVTQVHGSMEGQDIIAKVAEIKESKEVKEMLKEKSKEDQQNRISAFHRCKIQCSCDSQPCQAKGLRECSQCHNILRSVCSRAQCKKEDGSKPPMLKPFCEEGKPKKKLMYNERKKRKVQETDEEESEEEDVLAEEIESEGGSSSNDSTSEDEFEDEGGKVKYADVPTSSGTEPLKKIPISKVSVGDWVKVKFEEQLFTGKVEEGHSQKKGKERKEFVRVRCLQLPYPIREPQEFEKGNDACDYKEVFYCEERPQLVQDGRRGWKWIY